MCSTFEGPPRERKLQQLNSSGGRAKEDPNTNERELLRDPKDRNELQKEVFAALFSVPENSDEDGVEVQSIKKGDNDEEDSLQALRRAVMEYRGTMKEHCKAVGGSCSSRKTSRTGKVSIYSHLLTAGEEMMSNLEPLTKLQVLYLKKLPNSNSIYWKALPFPDVCRIFVFKCPELKKLPLDLERAGQGKILIKGKKDGWKQLQWEDQVTQNALLPFLKSTNK
ncbi:hypothetical protein CUMW_162720 [Citrus unshiu]|nr:hypothetical protein CUMW_162720 [Citrus unshiu]